MAVSDETPISSAAHAQQHNDDDLDPAAFLKSVRELSEKRDREDTERLRKLEEEVQRGKEERAIRRAERARSISPDKPTPSATPQSSSRPLSRATANASLVSSAPVTLTPPNPHLRSDTGKTPSKSQMEAEKAPAAASPTEAVPEFKGFASIKRSSTPSSNRSSTIEQNSSSTPIPSASNLARSGTLSWQQRPRPGSKTGVSRPQSMLSVENKLAEDKPVHTRNIPKDEPEPNRDQIAASLGARDPSWFKQTADRGIGSAALRKSKDEVPAGDIVPLGRRGLPGMSRESSVEPEQQTSPPVSDSMKSGPTSRGGSVRGSTFSNSSTYSGTSTSSGKPDLDSLIAADEEQQKASPSFDTLSITSGDSQNFAVARALTMSTSQARLTNASDRPVSPTKGMGGFVQSAMMKRSDSQSKRWNAQPGVGLNRGNSVASNRSGVGGLQISYSMPKLEPDPSREGSNEHNSRSNSSSNDLTGLALNTSQDNAGFAKPALPRHHSRSKSMASNYSANEETGVPQSPGSPSKRFSPNKSSWIESSITRPDSPKPLPSKNATPSWMADLARTKAQRANGDATPLSEMSRSALEDNARPLSRPESPTKSTPFGPALVKRINSQEVPNSPQSVTPTNRLHALRLGSNLATSPAPSSPTSKPKEQTPAEDSIKSNASTDPESEKPIADTLEAATVRDSRSAREKLDPQSVPDPGLEKHPTPSDSEPAATREMGTVRPSRSQTLKSSPAVKTKLDPDALPKSPATEFRSQLKSRPPPDTKTKEEPEFLAKFGQLRKAQQEKYVAPDLLKDNIMRGKTGLAVTGGPVKTARKDELKESLQAKKDDIKKAKEEGRDLPGQAHHRKTSSVTQPPPSKPEALAKRELLGRSDSSRSIPERTREATPEALSRHKSLKQKPTTDIGETEATHTSDGTPPQLIAIERSSTLPSPRVSGPQPLSKQVSEPSALETKQSKLAARFNPGLASMLARGPPSATPSRPESPATPGRVASPAQNVSSEPPAAGAPLQDVRKDRAKGPKRRRGGARVDNNSVAGAEPDKVEQCSEVEKVATSGDLVAREGHGTPSSKQGQQNETLATSAATPKPNTSAGSIMMSSLNKSSRPMTTGLLASERNHEAAVDQRQIETPPTKPKPQALPGSAAALMRASLSKSPPPTNGVHALEKPATPAMTALSRPLVSSSQNSASLAKSPTHLSSSIDSPEQAKIATPNASISVPEFRGFGSARSQKAMHASADNKENSANGRSSVKSTVSQWGRRPAQDEQAVPSQIELPTKKDNEAAMRSASLLALSPQPAASNGLGISVEKSREKPASTPPASAGLPPKPAKSSRVVSGQLAEASPNKGSANASTTGKIGPKTAAGRLLIDAFGAIPKYDDSLAINTSAVITNDVAGAHLDETIKTTRKTVSVCAQDGTLKVLPPQEEYTFFDESTYICTNTITHSRGAKGAQVYVWAGEATSDTTVEAALGNAKSIARENGASQPQLVKQGWETALFLQALGGIFVTRRGSRETSPKQFMLCGRKHLGHIVFDEVDFAIESLCAGFPFLVSYPLSLQQTKLYLWKGASCSPEELSAARLAAMDLSETGEIIEVDGGVEFASFLKIYGSGARKSNIPESSALWKQKAIAPDRFRARLFRVQRSEAKGGLLTSLWNRRPSWSGLSPSRSGQERVDVEVKEISPLMQTQLEAEGCYLLDAYNELFVLLGPLHASQEEKVRDTIFAQSLLFASDYATMSASMEDRRTIPKCSVLFSGVPWDVKMLFRHWDDSRGLWGTASLMAGLTHGCGKEVRTAPLDDMLTEVCRN